MKLIPLVVALFFLTSCPSSVSIRPFKPAILVNSINRAVVRVSDVNASSWPGENGIIYFSRHLDESDLSAAAVAADPTLRDDAQRVRAANDLWAGNRYSFQALLTRQSLAGFKIRRKVTTQTGTALVDIPFQAQYKNRGVEREAPPAHEFRYNYQLESICRNANLRTINLLNQPCSTQTPIQETAMVLTISVPFSTPPTHGQEFEFELVETGTGQYSNLEEVTAFKAIYVEDGISETTPTIVVSNSRPAVGSVITVTVTPPAFAKLILYSDVNGIYHEVAVASGVNFTAPVIFQYNVGPRSDTRYLQIRACDAMKEVGGHCSGVSAQLLDIR